VIALRADIDALSVQEKNDVEYRSEVDGMAHACGHDVHTAVVLGTGLFLAELDKAGLLSGRVRLIFEPAEELLPSGAVDVIEDGGIAGVDRIYAVHCWPPLPVGQFGVRTGAVTAGCDMVKIKVAGPGGHTSRPQNAADLVLTLAGMATALPVVLSRKVDPRSGLSLVWGVINAGEAANRIPSEGILEGTVRCEDNRALKQAPELVKEAVVDLARMFGAEAELEYVRGVPASVNDAASVRIFRDAAAFVLGESAVVPGDASLGGDSFGFYQMEIPGAYIWMGTRPSGTSRKTDLHSGDYLPDEGCIRDAVKALAVTVLTAQEVVLV
jgi:amidohydrolase